MNNCTLKRLRSQILNSTITLLVLWESFFSNKDVNKGEYITLLRLIKQHSLAPPANPLRGKYPARKLARG